MAVNSVRHGFLCNNTSYNESSSTSTQYVVYASGKPSVEFAYFCRLTWSFDAQYCDKNQNLTMLALFYELFISCIY